MDSVDVEIPMFIERISVIHKNIKLAILEKDDSLLQNLLREEMLLIDEVVKFNSVD